MNAMPTVRTTRPARWGLSHEHALTLALAVVLVSGLTSCASLRRPPHPPSPVTGWITASLTKGKKANEVIFTLRNLTGDHLVIPSDATVCPPPGDGVMWSDDLIVNGPDGKFVGYRGIIACSFHANPPPDLTRLAPREVRRVTIDISKNYGVKAGTTVQVSRHRTETRLARFPDAAQADAWLKTVKSYDDLYYLTPLRLTPVRLHIRDNSYIRARAVEDRKFP